MSEVQAVVLYWATGSIQYDDLGAGCISPSQYRLRSLSERPAAARRRRRRPCRAALLLLAAARCPAAAQLLAPLCARTGASATR